MSEKKILGVCSWISDKFELDVGGLRIIFIAATILGLGSPILLYFILYLIKPGQY
tara:strand:+ start:197 stop:361 length:165 start_codon:yes stop_codon:yes gene_type:complete